MRSPQSLQWLEMCRLRIEQIAEKKKQGRELSAKEKYQRQMKRNIEICQNTRSAGHAIN